MVDPFASVMFSSGVGCQSPCTAAAQLSMITLSIPLSSAYTSTCLTLNVEPIGEIP